MEGTIDQSDFYVNNRISGKHAVFCSFFNTLFNRPDIFFGNGTAHNLVYKYDTASAFARLQREYNMPILTFTTGLLRVFVIDFLDCLGDGLAKLHTRSAYICLHLKFAQQTVHNNIKMQLDHASKIVLSGIFADV